MRRPSMPVRAPDEGPSGEKPTELAVGVQTIYEYEVPSGKRPSKLAVGIQTTTENEVLKGEGSSVLAVGVHSPIKEDEAPTDAGPSALKVGVHSPINEDEAPSDGESSALEVFGLSVNEDEAIEESCNPKLLRAVAKKHKIESTKSLVAAYNKTTNREERSVLLKWLKKYGERSDECLRPNAVLEYAELAKIIPRSTQEKDILKNLVDKLRSCIHQGEFLHENSGVALCRALVRVDPSVYDDGAQLRDMARQLLSSLSPQPMLCRRNFRKHEATFVSLHLIFLLLKKTRPYGIYEKEKQEFRRTIAEKEKAMELSCKYYPVKFCFKALRQAVERFELTDAPSPLTQAIRCASFGLCMLFRVFHFARNLARADVNPAVLEDAHMKCQAAIANAGVSKKPWFDPLQNLTASMLKATKDKKRIEVIHSNCENALESQRKMSNEEDLKALRFGIICQLGMVATEGASENTSKEAAEKLVDLATQEALSEGWANDGDILIALLDDIYKLHTIGKCSEKTKEGLQILHQFGERFAQQALMEWLDGEIMENKLRVRSRRESKAIHKQLCIDFGRDLGFIKPATIELNREDLKRTYLHRTFTTVASLFGGSCKSVKDMKHYVVIAEEIIEKRKGESRGGTQKVAKGMEQENYQRRTRDQMREYYEQKTKVTRPIALDDLFKRRSLKSGDPKSEIRRVLLYGDPGSGKTCISKVIAYKWASREMAQAFDAVYVVPVRVLNNAKTKTPQWTRLEEAISQICFSKRELPSDHADLISQLEDDLDSPSTLLMVDGLDEASDYADDLLSTAWDRSCKILFLSRPYNMRNVEERVDIQVKCLGFNDRQLRDYINTELPEDKAPKLIKYLRDSAAMWEMAHIPVTAHILCSLSKEHGIVQTEGRRASTFQIYNDMTHYVWKRFEENAVKTPVKKSEVFDDLEKIAFETLREGQILIHERFVMRHATSKNAAKTFKESGLLLLLLEGQEYQFPHLTFQEYFAGRHVAKCLRGKKPDEDINARDFISKQKYNQKYEVTLSFAMHAFAEDQGTDALKEMLSIVDSQPVEVLGVQHSMLRMRVLEATLGEAKKDVLATIKKDKRVLELAEGVRQLVNAGKNNIPIRRIVDKKLDKCPHVLEECTQILDDRVAEVKHLLVSTGDLSENDLDEVDGLLMLARHTPKRINDITQFVLHHMNTNRPQCQPHEAIERLEHIATKAPLVAREVVEMLDTECLNTPPRYRKQTTTAIAKIIEVVPEIIVDDVLSILKRRCEDANPFVRRDSTKLIARVLVEKPELADDIRPLLEKTSSDNDSSVRKEAMKTFVVALEAAPNLARFMLPMLERGLNDEYSSVRDEAMRSIERVLEVAPQIAENALCVCERHKREHRNEYLSVRRVLPTVISRVIEVTPGIINNVLSMLENACSDEAFSVREEAAKAIVKAIEVIPGMVNNVLPMLEKAFSDEASTVREEAIKEIARVIEVIPELASDVLPMLEKACSDEAFSVREEATKAIAKIIQVMPKITRELLDILKEACHDEAFSVREEATKAIAKVIELVPEIAIDALQTLEIACSDDASTVREEATKAVAIVIEMVSKHTRNVLSFLENLCDNKHPSVRKEATKTIANAIMVEPEIAGDVLPVLEKARHDEASSVRMEATKAIVLVIVVMPKIACELLDMLKEACHDEVPSAREEATKAIAKVIEEVPEIAIDALPTLEIACSDEVPSAREEATKAIAKVIEAMPEIALDALPTLEIACNDEASFVRAEATKAIANAITVIPEIAGNALPILEKACDDKAFSVREEAMKAIAKVIVVMPEVAGNALPFFQIACSDNDSSVCDEATKSIARVIGVAPSLVCDVLSFLNTLCCSKDSSVAKNLTKSIARVIEDEPELAGAVLPFLERLCGHKEFSVREEATKAIAKFTKVAPDLAVGVLPLLERACSDKNSYAREYATKAIANVIEVAPNIAVNVLPMLEIACSDEDDFVRMEATKAIAKVIEVIPKIADDVLPFLERLCRNKFSSVRKEATKAIANAIMVEPEIAGYVLPALKVARRDENSFVRVEATKAIVLVTVMMPEIACELLDMLKEACHDEVPSAREEATKAITKVIEVVPEIAIDALPTLEIACNDEASFVREEANKAIATVIEAVPNLVCDVLSFLDTLCRSSYSSVRESATKAIARVIAKEPELACNTLPLLERLCGDTDSSVREESTKAIIRVIEVAPEFAGNLLPMLEIACSDKESSVRKEATKALDSIDVDKMIFSASTFLSSYKTGFWLFFARNPLTITSSSTHGKVSLIFHKTSSYDITEWNKKAFDEYLMHLTHEFEGRFPGLLEYIGLKE